MMCFIKEIKRYTISFSSIPKIYYLQFKKFLNFRGPCPSLALRRFALFDIIIIIINLNISQKSFFKIKAF